MDVRWLRRGADRLLRHGRRGGCARVALRGEARGMSTEPSPAGNRRPTVTHHVATPHRAIDPLGSGSDPSLRSAGPALTCCVGSTPPTARVGPVASRTTPTSICSCHPRARRSAISTPTTCPSGTRAHTSMVPAHRAGPRRPTAGARRPRDAGRRHVDGAHRRRALVASRHRASISASTSSRSSLMSATTSGQATSPNARWRR